MGLGGYKVHIDQQSYSRNAVLTTTYADDYVTRGNGFQIQKRLTISGSTARTIELDIVPTSGMLLYSLPLQISPNQGNIFVDTFLAPGSSGGTTWVTPLNLNSMSSTASLVPVKIDVTVSGTRTGLREYTIGAPLTNQSSGGGVPLLDIPKIINNTLGRKMYIQIANQESSVTVADVCIIWFEITT